MSAGARRSIPRFLKRLPLLPGESVPSFVQRHCEANSAARMLHVLRLIQALSGEKLSDVRDIVYSQAALRAVEWLTGLPDGALEAHFIRSLQSTHLVKGHHVWLRANLPPRRQAICPLCIKTSPHAHTAWEFAQAPVCVEHGVELIESCPSCSAPLRYSRTRLASCGDCGFRLELAMPVTVSDATRHVAGLVQRPSMLAMGEPGATAPIDGEDLACLLRLCLPPAPGRDSFYGLAGHPGELAVRERVQALERFSRALAGTRIDNRRLVALAMERWPMMGMLPSATQVAHLEDVAREMDMDADAARLLCRGDEAMYPKRAAELFDGRPPQLEGESEVADFLGLDVHALRQLRLPGELVKNVDDLGHDMDQVLALQERKRSLCTPEDADAAFGLDGLAHALVELKVLTGPHSSDGTLLGVYPNSFAALASRLQSVIAAGEQEETSAVPLAQGLTYRMELRDIAWAVSQVASGSLSAYSWPAPQRLMNLRVDDRRLRQLVTRPSSPPLFHEA